MHFHVDGALAATLSIGAWCGAPPNSIPVLLFLTGLVGGIAHCGPMCGPFVLAQTATGGAAAPVLHRLAGGLLLPYHAGRLATYTGLGAMAAALGGAAVASGPVRIIIAALLLGAGLMFLAQAVGRWLPAVMGQRGNALTIRWAARLAGVSGPLLANPAPSARFVLGVVLGLLPCGFLYAALAAAAATRDPRSGAVAMLAFGLGTAPSLMLVGLGGTALTARWRALARRAVAPLSLFNAAVLGAMALSVIASP